MQQFHRSIMYLEELVERADVFRTKTYHDSHESRDLHDQLQATIDEAKSTHVGELSKSRARYDELLKKKEEELQQLTKDHKTELQKLKKEPKVSRDEAAQARKDLEDAKAQLAR